LYLVIWSLDIGCPGNELLKNELRLPVDAELLVPHRRPMRLIDSLVEYRDELGVVEAVISSENPLVGEEGMLDRASFVELIAQAYAAFKGYHDMLHGMLSRKVFSWALSVWNAERCFCWGLLKSNVKRK
jgi:hypothetical protein